MKAWVSLVGGTYEMRIQCIFLKQNPSNRRWCRKIKEETEGRESWKGEAKIWRDVYIMFVHKIFTCQNKVVPKSRVDFSLFCLFVFTVLQFYWDTIYISSSLKKKKKRKKRSTGIQFVEFRQFYIVIKPPLQLRYWWQDWGKRRILTNFWWKCKMAELLWTFWQILVLPICPGIVLLGIYQLIWKLMFK